MARIGIGITTNGRPNLLANLLSSITEHTFMDNVKIYVADDSIDKQGISKKKNECLRNLNGCEHVFLLDDDIEIIKDGWVEFFINSDKDHLLYLDPKFHGGFWVEDGVQYFQNCGGVFMYMSKKAIEKVGAFDEKFTFFGFEHADWSIRCLGERHKYPMLIGTNEYIYSHDYSNPNHKSSISDQEKREHVKNNWTKFFNEPIKSVHLPL